MSMVLGACTSLGEATVAGRPLIYKQGPGDASASADSQAPAPQKREEAPKAAAATPAARPATPAPAPTPVAPRTAAPAVAASSASASAAAAPADVFSRYTQATRYGDLLFVSGQIALDTHGDFDSKQSVEAQTRRALENVRGVLEANRLTMANVVSATVYLANISQLSVMDQVYHEFFRGTPPARTVVEVSHLPRGAQVQVSVVAGR